MQQNNGRTTSNNVISIIRTHASHLSVTPEMETVSLIFVMVRARSCSAYFLSERHCHHFLHQHICLRHHYHHRHLSFFLLILVHYQPRFSLSDKRQRRSNANAILGCQFKQFVFSYNVIKFAPTRKSRIRIISYMLSYVLIQFYPFQIYIGNNNNSY